jgi:long-chain acyl-CoA synthetase
MSGASASRPSTYRSLLIADGIRSAAIARPDKIAITSAGRSLPYRELIARIDRVSNLCRYGLGLRPGDRLLLVAPNCPEYIEIVVGAAQVGIVVATPSPRLGTREMVEICADSTPAVAIADAAWAETLRDLAPASLTRIVALGDDYEALLAGASDARPDEAARPEEWETFALPYTSGTTGRAKGVMLSQRSRVQTFCAMGAEYGCYSPDDRFLAIAPLYHGAGFAFATATLFFGGTCHLMSAFDPEATLRILADDAQTGIFMVPTHFNAIFGLPQAIQDRVRRSSLKTVISNAAPLPQPTKERIVDLFGAGLLHETYGSTEGGIVTNLRPEHQLRKQRCVGLPFPMTEIRLLGEDGAVVGQGEVGELFSRSPYLFNGYWGRSLDDLPSLRDGFVSAGDLARMDDEGFIYIVDRKTDMIISGGINIYPREVEEVLAAHPAVVEAAVVGVPDDYWGEAVLAFVVAGRAVDAETLVAYCAERLARYKAPKRILFIDALPRNTGAKVNKRALRALLETGPTPTIAGG